MSKRDPSVEKPSSSRKKGTPVRKRDHEMGGSGESPSKKRETSDDAVNHIFLVGFTSAEVKKYQGMMKKDWAIVESLSDPITHLVIKSMVALKKSEELLPIYYAVLRDLWVLRPSFLPTAARKKSLGGPRPLEDEKDHAYDGKEIDANSQAQGKMIFPTIMDIVRLHEHVVELKENGRPPILGSEPFSKVAILAGRNKEAKQRREELKLVMEAGGATVVEESVFKTWKTNRKKGEVEVPSMVVIINGETDVTTLGLDNEVIRDLLKARSPIFYEEFIMSIFMYRMSMSLDDLLLQSFVFIHEQWKRIDPDGKLQAIVMGEEEEDSSLGTPTLGERTPSGRRTTSRASSSARESSRAEQMTSEKKKGRKEKEEDKKEEEKKEKMKKEEEKKEKVKKDKVKKEEEKKEKVKKEEEKKKVVDRPKKGRGQKKEKKEEDMEEKEGEEKAAEAPKKWRGRQKKSEKKEEEEGEETASASKKVNSLFSKSVTTKEGEEMETDDVDPELADGNLDLLAEFEKEIEEKNGEGRKERSEKEMRELREMREDRGDGEEEEEGEQPVTPEPILFSQVSTPPEIEIPELLKKALEVKEEEEEDTKNRGSDEDRLVIDEKASDDGSDTIVGEGADDVGDVDSLSEGNDEKEGTKGEEGEGSKAPRVDEPASEIGKKSETITIEATKECETCNHLGSRHLYFNKQKASEIAAHFSSARLDWFDLIIDVRQRMPWLKEGKVLRPSSSLTAQSMTRRTMDLFYSFYHDLDDESTTSTLLAEINSSNAMEMFEAEWEEEKARRPSLDMMIKMLHEFAVKRHAEDLTVPERACAALRTCLPVFLPSSVYGRHYWLTVLAGGSDGIKGRAGQVVEEMAKRCRTFFIKALITSDCFLPCVAQFVTYFCEVDLLCAQTPVVDYDLPGNQKEEETQGSQRSTRARKSKRKRNPLEKFPLILLLVMELDEEPRRGLSEAAILMIQKLMENVLNQKRRQEWSHSATLQRALLCLLEAARWHCSMAATSALTGAERRRVKAAEAAGKSSEAGGEKVPVELQQNVLRVVRMMLKKGYPMLWVREALTLSWLADVINAKE